MSVHPDSADFIERNDRLLDLLEKKHPADYDEALNLYGSLAEELRPWMLRIARGKAWTGVSEEDAVAETIMKGFMTIHLQMGGKLDPCDSGVAPAKNFWFERRHGLTLENWLAALLLGPGAQVSGVLRTHNRRAHKNAERSTSSSDKPAVLDDVASRDALEAFYAAVPDDQEMAAAIASLPGRQRFIVICRFGFMEDNSPADLKKLASMCGLDAQKIAGRVRSAKINLETESLQMQEIALLLDLSVEQVRRDLKAAIGTLRSRPKDSAIAAE